MTTLDALNKKLSELKEKITQINENNINEQDKIKIQISMLDECEKVINDEALMVNYDFSKVIDLLETYNYGIHDLKKIINDIQSVFSIRNELNLSEMDMPLEENQNNTVLIFKDKIKAVKQELNNKLKQLANSNENKSKIDNLESLKNIFEGNGRRKYYTEDMFRDFYEEFNILSLPPEQAQGLLDGFYQTKNLSNRQFTEKINFEDAVSLFKEFFPNDSVFEHLLNEHKNEIVISMNLDNTREILQFFSDMKIIDKFLRPSLLKIALYGRADYIKEVIYPKVMSNNPDVIDLFYEDDLASIWIKTKELNIHRSGSFRKRRSRELDNENSDSLYATCHTIDYDEFWKNIDLLKKNIYLFDDKLDINDIGANLGIKTLPVWVLSKDIELCKLFKLGSIVPVPLTAIEIGDMEDKIHLAIELGLLNSPLTPRFLEMDKNIVKNDEFNFNYKKKKIYNQSIRNYFQRFLSKLTMQSINEYAYLFYKLKNEGYIEFYNDFFSSNRAGTSNPEVFDGMDKNNINDLISDNFVTDWYSESIQNYDEYDDIITEYTSEEKKDDYNEQEYISNSVLDEPLIKLLENNNTIMDVLTQNDEQIEIKNEYVYMFGDRIISRYKVLHNATILKGLYGYLNEDMVMTSIVRNSFLDIDTFDMINDNIRKGVDHNVGLSK